MRVGAWCWQDGGARLLLAGCFSERGTDLLAAATAARGRPREVIRLGVALTAGARQEIASVLRPTAGPPRDAVHDLRNALSVLRLRLQMMAANPALPTAAMTDALASVDAATVAVRRM